MDVANVKPNEKLDANVLNGFVPPPYLTGKLTNGPLTNGITEPNKIINGQRGLLPVPAMVPVPHGLPSLVPPPLHMPGGMLPPSPMRGLLPLPIPGMLPPLLYPPQNRLLLPANKGPICLPHINGSVDDCEPEMKFEPKKTEGQCSRYD